MTSQTPEETHNTREVEEVVKEFYKIFDTDNVWQGEDEWTKNVPIGNIEQWLRTTLHHQLQKARQDGYNAGLADGTDKPLLAIEQMLQKAREVELDRDYYEIAKKRIEALQDNKYKIN